ncbi:MAG TPA: FmdB family zinc ribbon protein [Thermoanaerobaculia bacterium]|nr:FmdB family zinc ribbon protein [Thermoanaerobaculia bacterium]
MPLYEYQCIKCAERVEILQKFSDPPYSHCPSCGGDMKKLFSAPAIQFKGSGFYKTDYPSSSAKSESKSESSSDSKGEAKAETKSETKSETKTETKSESKAD